VLFAFVLLLSSSFSQSVHSFASGSSSRAAQQCKKTCSYCPTAFIYSFP